MQTRLSKNVRRSRPRYVAAGLGFLVLLGAAAPGRSEEAAALSARTADASASLAKLATTLAEDYRTVRAVTIARGNCLLFEHYRKPDTAESQAPVHSVTKSVLSILVGIAIDQNFLRLDESLSELFPDEFDQDTDPLARKITVRDLLTKTAGFAETGEGDFKVSAPVPGKSRLWRWMLNRKVAYPAGTHFRYDNAASDLLSVVLSKAIGRNAGSFAKESLFEPLGIANYTWPSDSEGYLHGASGLSLTASDMTKIGILYLQHGRWGEKQIVADAYVQDSTSRHNAGGRPVKAAYGYHWWVNRTSTGQEAFFAAGTGSQLIYVVPQRKVVIAVLADGIPGGSQRFVNNVVLPVEAELPDELSCTAQYGNGS